MPQANGFSGRLLLAAACALASLGGLANSAQAQAPGGSLGFRPAGSASEYARWHYRHQQRVPLSADQANNGGWQTPKSAEQAPSRVHRGTPTASPSPSRGFDAQPASYEQEVIEDSAGVIHSQGPTIRPVFQPDSEALPARRIELDDAEEIPFDDQPIRPEEPLPPLPSDREAEADEDDPRRLEYVCPDHGTVRPIDQLTDLIGPPDGALPKDCPVDRDTPLTRAFPCSTFTWKASALCHKPLYFEEVGLERYGHTISPAAQPVISGATFLANVVLLPYHVGVNPPWECQYALGYYRPGSCAPFIRSHAPLEAQGIALQVVAIGAIVALMP